jgi:hypothetical protein
MGEGKARPVVAMAAKASSENIKAKYLRWTTRSRKGRIWLTFQAQMQGNAMQRKEK